MRQIIVNTIRTALLLIVMTTNLNAGRADEVAPAPPSLSLMGDLAAPKKIAAIVTTYHPNSHADVIVTKILDTSSHDGKGYRYPLQIVSLYTDQVPENDLSRGLAAKHGIPIYETVEQALTLGTGKLAVDGVLLVAEHGKYPDSPTGNKQYPKRRLFKQIVDVFKRSGRVVPVFNDKHLADNWTDAKWMYDNARELHIPMMAGSSLPVLWRYPPTDVEKGAKLRQVVVLSYHTLDHYGFHALELLQALAERRAGGETGIAAVQCLTGDAVWEAGDKSIYDKQLFDEAFARLRRPLNGKRSLKEVVKEPVLFIIDYRDGLRANVLTLNGAVGEWAAAWRYADDRTASTLFWTQEWKPFQHFAFLDDNINQMMQSGKPTYPVERTLMTSGALNALLISKLEHNRRVKTPYLKFAYKVDWTWHQPPDPVPPQPSG